MIRPNSHHHQTTNQQLFYPNFTSQVQRPSQKPYTTLYDLTNKNQLINDQDQEEILEEGLIDTSGLSLFNPLYKQLKPSKDDQFYLNFFENISKMVGKLEKDRYQAMNSRFKKFFVLKEGLQRGQRWSKRIQPDYSKQKTFSLSNAVMIYGVDYLSNQAIKKIFGIPKQSKNIKRINWSNAVLFFQSTEDLKTALNPHLFDKEKNPFFQVKQEEEEEEVENTFKKRLPQGWYGLRPYEHKDEYIFWFVRYLTSEEPNILGSIKQRLDFLQTYSASKKLWQKKKKERLYFNDSFLSTSREKSIILSKNKSQRKMQSQPELRERSRQKTHDGYTSQIHPSSDVFSDSSFEQLDRQNKKNLDKSPIRQMSFIYTPNMNALHDVQLKKKSDEIIMMMECLQVGPEENILECAQEALEDDDMAIISDNFDPKGLDQHFFFDRTNKVSELTQLRPEFKFNYSEYVQRLIQAEEEVRQKKKLPVIQID